MKKIHFSDSIKNKIQSLQFGLIEASNIKVISDAENFDADLEKLIVEINQKFADKAPSEDPTVSAIRRMYRDVGWEPTKYRPSSEALIRRLLKGKGLYRINNVVDYGNLVSARFHIPMGLYDLDKVSGNIFIDTGRENESYAGISKPKINAGGKIILRDDQGVFGNPTADSIRTSISKETKNILAVFFCPHSLQQDLINNTLAQLSGFYANYTSAENIKTDIQVVK